MIVDSLPSHLLLVPRGLIADHVAMDNTFIPLHNYDVISRNYFNSEIGILQGKVVIILNHSPQQNFELLNHMKNGGLIDQVKNFHQANVQSHLDHIMNNKEKIEREYLISQI